MLTYGSKFQYDEFLQAGNKVGAILGSLGLAVVGICLMMFSPVCFVFPAVVHYGACTSILISQSVGTLVI